MGRSPTARKTRPQTRFNSTKHGLLAVGITELDDAEGYRATLSDLMREQVPVGPVETSSGGIRSLGYGEVAACPAGWRQSTSRPS
jgi:hypothetical protein